VRRARQFRDRDDAALPPAAGSAALPGLTLAYGAEWERRRALLAPYLCQRPHLDRHAAAAARRAEALARAWTARAAAADSAAADGGSGPLARADGFRGVGGWGAAVRLGPDCAALSRSVLFAVLFSQARTTSQPPTLPHLLQASPPPTLPVSHPIHNQARLSLK
jgi:hypothetical protein